MLTIGGLGLGGLALPSLLATRQFNLFLKMGCGMQII
jgi:hypothetical protein